MSIPFENKVVVRSAGQKIFVDPAGEVTVVHGGPPGPPGADGADGGSGTGGSTDSFGLASRERISAAAQPNNPIVTYDTDTWDTSEIREPGAAIYDPVTELWILPYTVENIDGTQGAAVISADGGETWTPHTQNPILPFQEFVEYGNLTNFDDPYVAKTVSGQVWRDSTGRAHIYAEEKDGTTHHGIGRWVSGVNTLDDWVYTGRVIAPLIDTAPNDLSTAWDYTDRTSPAVLHDGVQLICLFEGRNLPSSARYDEWQTATPYLVGDIVWVDSPLTYYRCVSAHTSATVPPNGDWEVYSGGLGQTGHAVSTDEGETWTPHDANPIILLGELGSWSSTSVVIDDVIKVGDEWIALVHSADDDGVYTVGRYRTTDAPIDWGPTSFVECVGNPYDSHTNTMMCWDNDPTQGLCIRQLESNPGVGERLERVWITPTVGVSGASTFDPSGLQDQITSLDGRADNLETSDAAQQGAINAILPQVFRGVDDAAFSAHFAADVSVGRFLVTDALVDIYSMVGPASGFQPIDTASNLDPGAGPIVLIPDPVLTEQSQGAAGLVPSPPTDGAQLFGLRFYGLAVDTIPTGTSNSVLLGLTSGGPNPTGQRPLVRGAGADNWEIADDFAMLTLTQASTIPAGPVDALFIVEPSNYPAIGYVVNWFSNDLDGTLPTVTIESAEWIWYIPASDLSGSGDGAYALVDHDHSGVYSPVGHSHAAGDISSGQLVTAQLPNIVPLYGTGVDGNVTITGTVTLTSDMHYNNLVVNGTLDTDGYRVFVAGTLSGTGTIHTNGTNGSGLSAGAGGGVSTNAPFIKGVDAGNGTTTAGNQCAAGTTNQLGGSAGAGGAGTGNVSVAGRSVAPPIESAGGIRNIYDPFQVREARPIGSSTGRFAGGNGGTGGSGDGTYTGGGGGGGGGVCVVFARDCQFAGSIQAVGGAGATRTTGNVGGGGGGGGGFAFLCTKSTSVSASIVFSGGSGGNGVGSGTAGVNGSPGNGVLITGVA